MEVLWHCETVVWGTEYTVRPVLLRYTVALWNEWIEAIITLSHWWCAELSHHETCGLRYQVCGLRYSIVRLVVWGIVVEGPSQSETKGLKLCQMKGPVASGTTSPCHSCFEASCYHDWWTQILYDSKQWPLASLLQVCICSQGGQILQRVAQNLQCAWHTV